jgi:hypothetical protein
MARLEIEVRNLDRIREYFQKSPVTVTIELTKAIRGSAVLVERYGKQEAPVDRGELRSSIRPRFMHLAVAIGPHAKYAVPVHEGSKPHWPPIKAFTGKEESLDLWARRHGVSAFAVARSIARKGTKPNPFMERAAVLAKPGVLKLFDKAADKIIKG